MNHSLFEDHRLNPIVIPALFVKIILWLLATLVAIGLGFVIARVIPQLL
jgi:hypothetical protein